MKRRQVTCVYCGEAFNKGNFHHCPTGVIIDPGGKTIDLASYREVMENQERLRTNKQLWEIKMAEQERQAEDMPPDWPMTTADPEVRWYINELHEMILDLNLRISDLEEERG